MKIDIPDALRKSEGERKFGKVVKSEREKDE